MEKVLHLSHEILALDSIYGVLDWEDRIKLHLARLDRYNGPATATLLAAYHWIIRNAWEPPKARYLKDQDGLFCLLDDRWLTTEEYQRAKPITI